jgi:hypothetical protein
MAVYRTVLVKAEISRGGFSNERTYTLQTPNGPQSGLAPWIYCFDKHLVHVKEEPPEEKVIKGFVQADVISDMPSGMVKLSLPGNDVYIVNKDQLDEKRSVPKLPEDYASVSV